VPEALEAEGGFHEGQAEELRRVAEEVLGGRKKGMTGWSLVGQGRLYAQGKPVLVRSEACLRGNVTRTVLARIGGTARALLVVVP